MDPRKDRETARARQWLEGIMNELEGGRYFGKLEIDLEKGRIVKIKKIQTILPPHRGEF